MSRAKGAPKRKVPKMVMVVWEDITEYAGEWKSYGEMSDVQPAKVCNIGFIVAEDARRIILTSYLTDDGEDGWEGGTPVVIPRGCVVQVKRLG
jgi:hypothetical protein